MEGSRGFSARSLLDPGRERAAAARRRGPGTERCLGSGTATPGSGSEAGAPWSHPRCVPTARPRRRRCLDSPRESRSLTDVAARPPDRARRSRPHGRRLEEAWAEPGAGAHSPFWQRQPPGPWHCPPAQGDSPPPSPEGASSPLSGIFGVRRAQSGDQWAVPLGRGPGCRSPSSALSERSSVRAQEFGAPSACACAHKREGSDPGDSAASQLSQASASRREQHSAHARLLRTELEEALTSSRDQKIVALVLSRLKKAQRMRELQQQAAAAWEELKRSDQKVQLTLERERERLLQEGREQWRRKERRVRRREGPARTAPGSERASGAGPGEEPERAPKPAPATPRQNRELGSQAPQRAGPRKSAHRAAAQETARETSLSSVVNYEARRVLLDCQAKAEELLRKLALEQRALGEELRPGPPRHQEPLQQVRGRAEAEEQVRAHRRLLAELAERRARRAGGGGDELGVLKLKAEKEGRGHIEGIKEAIRRKQQRREHISRERERDATLEGFQKLSRAPPGDQARAQRAREEAQPRAGPQGC